MLQELFKRWVENASGEVFDVCALCEELRKTVLDIVGPQHADYLGRASSVLANFGRTLEVTDGQHMLAVLQTRTGVLAPAVYEIVEVPQASEEGEKKPPTGNLVVGFAELTVDEALSRDHVLWAAKSVDATQSFSWMDEVLSGEVVPDQRPLLA